MEEKKQLQENEMVAKEFKQAEAPVAAAMSLEDSLKVLAKVGGFGFIESVIDGAKKLNPSNKALKSIFLNDKGKQQDRVDLKQKLDLWQSLLQSSSNVNEMVQSANTKAVKAEETLKKNLKVALDAGKELEIAYRSVALFFKNTEEDKVKNVTFINASMSDIKEDEDGKYLGYIREEMKRNYDRLDLMDNYSLLVVPGYLGEDAPSRVSEWGRVAHENKVMLVTDFVNLDKVEDVISEFEAAKLTSADMHKSNVMMACNWIVGRAKNEQVEEEEDVMVPPSAALAGRMYRTLMSQVAAGAKHGALIGVDSVKFEMKKSDIGLLDKIGVVPMVKEYGKVMAFSAKTLFNGDNIGLQTYSVVRVFDYINKALIDFLNRRAFENWTVKTEQDLRKQIVNFLDKIQGPGKLIEKFNIRRFEKDDQQKDRIHLDINITPYFPAKSFMLKLDGTKGDGGTNWDTATEQQ